MENRETNKACTYRCRLLVCNRFQGGLFIPYFPFPSFSSIFFLCIFCSVDEIMREKFGMSRRKKIHTQNSRRCSFLLGDKWNKFAVKKALIEKPSTHQCSTSTNATLPLGHTRIPMYNDSIKHGVLFFHRSTATVNEKKGRVDQRITFHQMVNRFRFVTVSIMYLRNVPIS